MADFCLHQLQHLHRSASDVDGNFATEYERRDLTLVNSMLNSVAHSRVIPICELEHSRLLAGCDYWMIFFLFSLFFVLYLFSANITPIYNVAQATTTIISPTTLSIDLLCRASEIPFTVLLLDVSTRLSTSQQLSTYSQLDCMQQPTQPRKELRGKNKKVFFCAISDSHESSDRPHAVIKIICEEGRRVRELCSVLLTIFNDSASYWWRKSFFPVKWRQMACFCLFVDS